MPRPRRLLKWTLHAAALTTAALILFSGCLEPTYTREGRYHNPPGFDTFHLAAGRLEWLTATARGSPGLRLDTRALSWRWTFESYIIGDLGVFGDQRNVPLWPLATALTPAAAATWLPTLQSAARRRAGKCPRCAYNLRGLPPNI